MAKIDKIIEKTRAGSKNVTQSEAIKLLEHLSFTFERQTRHCLFYCLDERIISFNRNREVLHPKAVKELRNLIEDLLDA